MRIQDLRLGVLLCACVLMTSACDDPAEKQARAVAGAQARARAEEEARRQAHAHEAELREQAEREKRALEQQERATREQQARGALGACCQVLARRGFEQRNMKDMAAKALCLEAETKGDALSAIMPSLREALGERELPPACQAN